MDILSYVWHGAGESDHSPQPSTHKLSRSSHAEREHSDKNSALSMYHISCML